MIVEQRTHQAMGFRGAARTDVGRRRGGNEDSFGIFPDLSLFVVSDGMGGHAGGEVASSIAVESIQQSLLRLLDQDLTPIMTSQGLCSLQARRLMLAVRDANEAIRVAREADPALGDMGATVVALAFDVDNAVAAMCHVGDSRIYRIREGTIEQVTEDHTLVQRLVKSGRMTPEDAATDGNRHILTRALGVDALVEADLRVEGTQPGDVFVLCSDGIHDSVTIEEIASVVTTCANDWDGACRMLIEMANARGGKDNSTVVIIACEPGMTQ